ncbi:hypothetical protein ACFSYG_13025 [Leeuwenhoekiella polynyae]|nr:hypothetical protein [Leeuwenhoekiella polynyae]
MVKLILILLNLFLALQGVAQENGNATPWQEDLRFFQNTIHEDYPFLFVKTSPEAFDREEETLYAEIPNLKKHKIIVGIFRLISVFNRGYTP